jgi:hypothetical protein
MRRPALSANRLRLIRKMRAMSRQCGNMEFFSYCSELVFWDGGTSGHCLLV